MPGGMGTPHRNVKGADTPLFGAGELGAPSLARLPSDPRERVLCLYPHLPGVYLTEGACRRISNFVDDLSSPFEQRHAAAEVALKELSDLHDAISATLNGEGFLWQGGSLRGVDILSSLSDGSPRPAPLTPRTRTAVLVRPRANTTSM